MDYELYHTGVKGMKWGRRKAATTSGKPKPKTPVQTAQSMSQTRLKSKVERLRLEKEYVKLHGELELMGKTGIQRKIAEFKNKPLSDVSKDITKIQNTANTISKSLTIFGKVAVAMAGAAGAEYARRHGAGGFVQKGMAAITSGR